MSISCPFVRHLKTQGLLKEYLLKTAAKGQCRWRTLMCSQMMSKLGLLRRADQSLVVEMACLHHHRRRKSWRPQKVKFLLPNQRYFLMKPSMKQKSQKRIFHQHQKSRSRKPRARLRPKQLEKLQWKNQALIWSAPLAQLQGQRQRWSKHTRTSTRKEIDLVSKWHHPVVNWFMHLDSMVLNKCDVNCIHYFSLFGSTCNVFVHPGPLQGGLELWQAERNLWIFFQLRISQLDVILSTQRLLHMMFSDCWTTFGSSCQLLRRWHAANVKQGRSQKKCRLW